MAGRAREQGVWGKRYNESAAAPQLTVPPGVAARHFVLRPVKRNGAPWEETAPPWNRLYVFLSRSMTSSVVFGSTSNTNGDLSPSYAPLKTSFFLRTCSSAIRYLPGGIPFPSGPTARKVPSVPL